MTDHRGHAHAHRAGLGVRDTDGTDLRRRKELLVRLCLITVPAAIVWGALYWSVGERLAGAVPWAYAAIVVGALGLFALTRRLGLLRDPFLLAILAAPALMTLVLGGFDPSSAVILWALLSPLAAIVFAGASAARWWFVAYVATLVGATALAPTVRPSAADLPDALHLAMLAMNIGAVSLLAFLLVSGFARQREDAEARADALLLNILPRRIADQLKARHGRIAEQIEAASVVFADVVDFTPLSSRLPPDRVVDLLDRVFSTFDDLAESHGLEKIKTIGDCYMAAAGVPVPRHDHARAAADMALAMAAAVEEFERDDGSRLALRIGINSGPVVAGVIGRTRFIYDLWGDVVNTASRMESHGTPGRIQITEATHALLERDYECVPRGRVAVKGKGEIETWFLVGQRISTDRAHGAAVPRPAGRATLER